MESYLVNGAAFRTGRTDFDSEGRPGHMYRRWVGIDIYKTLRSLGIVYALLYLYGKMRNI